MIDPATFIDMLDAAALNGHCGEPHPYSGRAMYGKRCVAVSGDMLSEWSLALALADACRYRLDGIGGRLSPYSIPEPRSDSLGRGVVLYWPQIAWPEDRRDPDEEPDED